MANQIQATVYLVDNTLQAEPFAMSFFTSNISIRSGSSSLSGSVNSVIQYYYSLTNPSEYKEYYVSETIDTLVAAAGNTQVQCTVLNINGTSQVSGGIEFSFPSEQISIFPSTGLFTDVNAYILFKGNKFYTDDTVDTLKATANVGDYKVYTALLTQSGTDAPVATVLQNTLGGTVVWTRDSAGSYLANSAGLFSPSVAIFLSNYQLDPTIISRSQLDGASLILVSSWGNGTLSDDSLIASIRIEVYP